MPAAAYCDVDGTLAATNIVMPLLWFRKQRGSVADSLWLASLPIRAPYWLVTDKLNRGFSNRAIYRSYRGLRAASLKEEAARCFEECIKPKLFTEGMSRLDDLRSQGCRLVLVTGSPDFIMRPLAHYLQADLIAVCFAEKDGIFTGELSTPALTGKMKEDALERHAREHHLDPAQCWAFGDAAGDYDMLSAVGHPVAVNPDGRLQRKALAHGWEIVAWKHKSGVTRTVPDHSNV